MIPARWPQERTGFSQTNGSDASFKKEVAAALKPSRPTVKRSCQPLYVTTLAVLCCCTAFAVFRIVSNGGLLGSNTLVAITTTTTYGHVLSAVQRLRCTQHSNTSTNATGCKQQQQRVLQGILRAAALDPSLWRTWDTAPQYQPVYGAWQLFQQPTHMETAAQNAVSPALRHVPRGTRWLVAVAPVWPPADLAVWASLKDWNVVVVTHADVHVAKPYDCITVLTPEAQQALPLVTATLNSGDRRAQKNLGYLYAIANGADVVLDAEDGLPLHIEEAITGLSPETPLVADASGVVNPWRYFGWCKRWPAGYPLTTILAQGLDLCVPDSLQRQQQSNQTQQNPIHHVLVDHPSDMDAIGQLMGTWAQAADAAPPTKQIVVAPGAMSPYGLSNTAYQRSALWALFLPSGLPRPVAAVWRSYWAQRLLQDTGGLLQLTLANNKPVNNTNTLSTSKDLQLELQMYVQASGLVSYLSSWRCEHSTLFDCMLQCGHDMARHGFWPHSEVERMAAWIQDLAALGYVPPVLLPPQDNLARHGGQDTSRNKAGDGVSATVKHFDASVLHRRWLQLMGTAQCSFPASPTPAVTMQSQGSSQELLGAASSAAVNTSQSSASNCSQAVRSALQDVLHEASQHPEAWRVEPDITLLPPVYGSWAAVPRTQPQAVNGTHGTSGQEPVARGSQWVIIHCRTAASLSKKTWQQWGVWKAIILVEEATLQEQQLPDAVVLTQSALRQLPWKLAQHVDNRPAHSMLAALYAIHHGAEVVYSWDADATDAEAAGPKWMLPTEVNTAVWTKGDGQLVNPFWHLRQCSTPARGFHLLGLLHNSSRCSQLQLSNLEAVGHTPIQQGTACLPAAAAWQLVTGQEGAGGQLPAVAPLLLASGDYAPYYAHNVIHTRSALWALFIPADLSSGVQDVWRGYWAQRLLSDMGGHLLYVGQQGSSPTPPIGEGAAHQVLEELQASLQADALTGFLRSWTCAYDSLPDCMLELSYDMAAAGFWPSSNVALMSDWVHDLAAVGYDMPALAARRRNKQDTLQALTAAAHAALDVVEIKRRAQLVMQSRTSCAALDMEASSVRGAGSNDTSATANKSPLYLSMVLVTQNSVDKDGQHFRLSLFLKHISDNVQRYPVLKEMLEVILVDFGTDVTLPPIQKLPSIRMPDLAHMPLMRIIRVPPSVAQAVNQKMFTTFEGTYWEFVAKNLGVRRACGRYVLTTNPDAYFTKGWWAQLAQRPYDEEHYFRLGRTATKNILPTEALDWPGDRLENTINQNRVFGSIDCCSLPKVKWYENGIATDAWLYTPVAQPFFKTDWPAGQLLFDAPGEFTLLSRRAWHAIRGYPEIPSPTKLDDALIAAASAFGLKAASHAAPAVLYHLEHPRSGYGADWALMWRVHGTTWDPWMKDLWHSLVELRQFKPYNMDDWGMQGAANLPETVV